MALAPALFTNYGNHQVGYPYSLGLANSSFTYPTSGPVVANQERQEPTPGVRDVYTATDNGVTTANDLTDLITRARAQSLGAGQGGGTAGAAGAFDDVAGAASGATSGTTSVAAAGAADDVAGAATGAGNAAGAGRFVRGVGAAGNVLAPVSVVTGAMDTRNALSDLSNANSLGEAADAGVRTVSGGAATVSGGAGVVAAAAGASRFAGLSGAAAVAGTAAKVSGVAGGVAGVAEGGLQIYHGVKEGDYAKAGRGALKAGAGGLMIAGVATANPILLAAGGALYAGTALWENREAIGKAVKKGAEVVSNGARAVGGAVVDGVSAVGRGVENVAEGVSDVAGAAADKVKSVGSTAKKMLGSIF
jgi:hypothetical protein